MRDRRICVFIGQLVAVTLKDIKIRKNETRPFEWPSFFRIKIGIYYLSLGSIRILLSESPSINSSMLVSRSINSIN